MTNYKEEKVSKDKTIALVAHDGLKDSLFKWLEENKDLWIGHKLCGTGTTASLIKERFSVDIKAFLSGPLGGDQQIGSAIAQGDIDLLIFFWDPLEAQPHDPDVKALLRIAVLYDVPVAMSPSAATALLKSPLIGQEYNKKILQAKRSLEERSKEYK